MSWHQPLERVFFFFKTEHDSESKPNWFQLSQLMNLFLFSVASSPAAIDATLPSRRFHRHRCFPGVPVKKDRASLSSPTSLQSKKVQGHILSAKTSTQWERYCILISEAWKQGWDAKEHSFIKPVMWAVVSPFLMNLFLYFYLLILQPGHSFPHSFPLSFQSPVPPPPPPPPLWQWLLLSHILETSLNSS